MHRVKYKLTALFCPKGKRSLDQKPRPSAGAMGSYLPVTFNKRNKFLGTTKTRPGDLVMPDPIG